MGNFVKFGGELGWGRKTTFFLPVTSHISETVQGRGFMVTMDHLPETTHFLFASSDTFTGWLKL